MQDRSVQGTNDDNGFIKQKAITKLEKKCGIILEKSPQLKSIHLRIPICIGYSEDLTPLQFETFVDQIQAFVDEKNRLIDVRHTPNSLNVLNLEGEGALSTASLALRSPRDYHYSFTFYLAPNEDPAAIQKNEAWMVANRTLIESLQRNNNLVFLETWRLSPRWTEAQDKYEKILRLEDYATKEKKPFDWLEEDATKFQEGCKKHNINPLPLADLIEIAKKKVVDILSWAVLENSPRSEASIIIHYSPASKAMINILQQIEKLGYIKHSCAYLDFPSNKNIKKLGVEPMPQVNGQQKQFKKNTSLTRPMSILSSGSSSSNSSAETQSTDTNSSPPEYKDLALILDLCAGLAQRGMDARAAAVSAYALFQEVKQQGADARKRASLNKSGAHSAPASPPSNDYVASESDNSNAFTSIVQVPGTLYNRERASSHPSSPGPQQNQAPNNC